jgi:hypothetical protein
MSSGRASKGRGYRCAAGAAVGIRPWLIVIRTAGGQAGDRALVTTPRTGTTTTPGHCAGSRTRWATRSSYSGFGHVVWNRTVLTGTSTSRTAFSGSVEESFSQDPFANQYRSQKSDSNRWKRLPDLGSRTDLESRSPFQIPLLLLFRSGERQFRCRRDLNALSVQRVTRWASRRVTGETPGSFLGVFWKAIPTSESYAGPE